DRAAETRRAGERSVARARHRTDLPIRRHRRTVVAAALRREQRPPSRARVERVATGAGPPRRSSELRAARRRGAERAARGASARPLERRVVAWRGRTRLRRTAARAGRAALRAVPDDRAAPRRQFGAPDAALRRRLRAGVRVA